nr:unnamed protein product [Callosobruchus analis]
MPLELISRKTLTEEGRKIHSISTILVVSLLKTLKSNNEQYKCFRLYCTWHIDRAWRNNLNKLQRQELKKDVQLRTLLQERDPEAFPIMLNDFVESMLSSAESNEFGRYFKQYYVENAVSWAYCYRRGAGINTNMHIERMHQTIKYIYLEGKSIQRFDKTIHILMKFVKDKLFDRLISMNKGKITSKITELRKRHKNSQNMNITSVTQSEMGWHVPSSSTGEIYLIQELKINCNCKLSCSLCEACLHAYSCSCLDNSIRWNMCKHIHLVCQYKKSVGENCMNLTRNEDEENDLVIDETKNESYKQQQELIHVISKKKDKHEDLQAEKEKLKRNLTQQIEKITNFEQLEAFKKILRSLEPTMATLREKQ